MLKVTYGKLVLLAPYFKLFKLRRRSASYRLIPRAAARLVRQLGKGGLLLFSLYAALREGGLRLYIGLRLSKGV
jgi:hypothetical protein